MLLETNWIHVKYTTVGLYMELGLNTLTKSLLALNNNKHNYFHKKGSQVKNPPFEKMCFVKHAEVRIQYITVYIVKTMFKLK